MINLFVAFGCGLVFGVAVTLVIYKLISFRNDREMNSAIDTATERLKAGFAEISQKTLAVTTDHMIKLASQKLGSEREISFKEIAGQKNLIEARISALNGELDKLTILVNDIESKRNRQMGELQNAISESQTRASELYKVTNGLREILSSKQHRGQWAERMADDILSYSGLKEGINYKKQEKDSSTGNRPDFTFLLPNGMKLNMDVKFPFENYQKYVLADTKEGKALFKKEFFKDVKKHMRDVSSRDYINPEENTLDCVILFIPNEGIYNIIFETDITILEEAAKLKILICSPVTILSVLAILRQAADNFVIENSAKDLLKAIEIFKKEWANYYEGFEKIGKIINILSKEYDALNSTRMNKLERSFRKFDSIDEYSEK